MNNTKRAIHFNLIIPYVLAGIVIGALFAIVEYIANVDTDDPQEFIPLIIRTEVVSLFIFSSVILFELFFKDIFTQKTFVFLVVVRSISFTIIISI